MHVLLIKERGQLHCSTIATPPCHVHKGGYFSNDGSRKLRAAGETTAHGSAAFETKCALNMPLPVFHWEVKPISFKI